MRPVRAPLLEARHEDVVGGPVRGVGPDRENVRPRLSRQAPVLSSPTSPGHWPEKLLASSSGLSLPTTPSVGVRPVEPVHADADQRVVDRAELLDGLVGRVRKPSMR